MSAYACGGESLDCMRFYRGSFLSSLRSPGLSSLRVGNLSLKAVAIPTAEAQSSGESRLRCRCSSQERRLFST